MAESIFKWVKKSSYGTFKTIYNTLFSENTTGNGSTGSSTAPPVPNVRLPKIIVVGSEKSGKSTVLEAITNRKFFPRHHKLCTKCPILLQMSESNATSASIVWRGEETFYPADDPQCEDISRRVKEIMDSLETYTEEVLIIKMTAPDLPNFELIDLPGLIATELEGQEGTKQKIEDMVDSFNDPDTLILCVVPATIPALKTNIAVDKVRKLNKSHKSILCLTMCDQVTNPEVMQNFILDRVMLSEEMRELGFAQFAGVVATAHLQSPASRKKEKQYFEDMFTEISEYRKENNLLDDLNTYRNDLMGNLMSTNIIRLLDRLFHGHITTEWCPNVLTRINEMIAEQQRLLAELGKNPNDCNVNEILAEVNSKLSKQTILNEVSNTVKKMMEAHQPEEAILACEKQSTDAFTSDEVARAIKFQDAVGATCRLFAVVEEENAPDKISDLREAVIASVNGTIAQVFEQQENKELMIRRFEDFQTRLASSIHKSINDKDCKEQDEASFMTCVNFSLANLSMHLTSYRKLWFNLQQHATLLFSIRAESSLRQLTAFVSGLGPSFSLIEAPAIATERSRLEEELRLLRERHHNIANLGNFIRMGPERG
mmetsp:Transcript_13520/g.14687  ORF Transcript_13520/g.14687 Transcript_13520/m.14687 type:complete len:600 (+) Transcript_13520:44-1843(+)|eukprot:CAMPEP_0173150362 /NCGR_PEP_ID=MMETSP1105-20130129/10918_1 /TAXON_ID=2985 /ORGANISM="Ochromonas sp., Strain BG-1" /LENGTH=599 /DNA_ID=CAMNT_0014065489 /DNA_START=40 /DNA_END=1839 /DNA_ORIENTATION=-